MAGADGRYYIQTVTILEYAPMAIGAMHFKHLRWFDEKLSASHPFARVVLYVGGEVVSLHRALDLTLDDRPQARVGQFKRLSVGAVICVEQSVLNPPTSALEALATMLEPPASLPPTGCHHQCRNKRVPDDCAYQRSVAMEYSSTRFEYQRTPC